MKLCFDNSNELTDKPNNEVACQSVDLMRFHPFFIKLSYYAVKDFLT